MSLINVKIRWAKLRGAELLVFYKAKMDGIIWLMWVSSNLGLYYMSKRLPQTHFFFSLIRRVWIQHLSYRSQWFICSHHHNQQWFLTLCRYLVHCNGTIGLLYLLKFYRYCNILQHLNYEILYYYIDDDFHEFISHLSFILFQPTCCMRFTLIIWIAINFYCYFACS